MPATTTKSRSRPRPNRRQQALIFVEPFTNPVQESKQASTKHLVKKYSMLNRKNEHHASLDEPNRISYGRGLTQILDRLDHDELDEERDRYSLVASKRNAQHRFTSTTPHNIPGGPLGTQNDDPFDALPVQMSKPAFDLLHRYMTTHYIEKQPWFQADEEYGSLLIAARRQTWFPVAKDSPAACSALVALTAAASPFTSDFGPIRDSYLTNAFRLTNLELQSDAAVSNGTVFAVVMLMLTALIIGDERAFKAHTTGMASVLVHRSQHPERKGKHIRPQWYPFEAYRSLEGLSFSGSGITELAQKGFISDSAWSTYFREAMLISSLIVLTPGDTFWYSCFAQHKWLTRNPDSLGSTPLDKVFHSTLRLVWHLIAWRGALLTSPIVRGMILEIFQSLNASDAEDLLSQQPEAITWIALSAGPHAMNLQRWFHVMLRLSLAATGMTRFDVVVQSLAKNYLWHPTMNASAERFWRNNPAETAVADCCTDVNSNEQLEASFESLELEGRFVPELATQNLKCRTCLCAWWV